MGCDVACTVAELFFKEFLIPIFWIFKSLVQQDHRLVFQFVLKQHGMSPDQVMLKPGHSAVQAVGFSAAPVTDM